METEFTTQQTAEQTGISAHTLRYYERIGLILDVQRDANGYRCYTASDLEWIGFLRQLKATGMPLTQMQAFAELRRQGDSTAKQRRELLESHRQTVVQQIEKLNDCLGLIDYKIDRQRQRENR